MPTLMARNPNDVAQRMAAAPMEEYADSPQATQMMAPVDPHATLTAPIGPAPVRMTNELGDALTEQAEAPPAETPKMSPLQGQREHVNKSLMANYSKDENPYGSENNHPGFFGKILHGLNVATGGVNRRGWEERQQEGELRDIAKEESAMGLQGAQAGNLGAEQAKTEETTREMPGKNQSEADLQAATTGNLKSETNARNEGIDNPSLIVGHAHAVNKALSENRDPAIDPIVQAYEDRIQSLQKQPAEQGVGKTTDIKGPDGKVHTMGYNSKTGKFDIDEGESGFKPAVTHVSLGESRMEKNDLLKAYQPTLDSAERMNVMTESYEKAIKDHDQQAMLNLLANHLGMTMGLQKGARLTKDIINEAKQSQPWLQGLQSKFDKDGYLAGVTLSPPQMRQMVNLGQERYAEDAKKSRSTAAYLGANDDGPARFPGKATINFYLGQANGDAGKAKALAVQDGWTVK